MKPLSIAFAILALCTGLVAAFFWYKSSKVPINSNRGPNWGLPGTGSLIEPVEPEMKALDLAAASIKDDQSIVEAIQRAGGLNQIAALWTAASVAASAMSAILGAMN